MRKAILDAAKSLFAKEGFETVSMRRISAAIDYSPAAIYRYFKNKREILSTLRDDGFKQMVEQQEERVRLYPDPVERLKAGGMAYIQFALDDPDYFQLMFCTSCDEVDFDGELAKSSLKSYDIFRSNVADCIKQGRFGDVNLDVVVVALWSSVQGMAQLILSGRLDVVSEDIDFKQLVDSALAFQLRPGGPK